MTTTFILNRVEITRDGFNVYKSGENKYIQCATRSKTLHEDEWLYRDHYGEGFHSAAFTNENDAAEYIAYRFHKLSKMQESKECENQAEKVQLTHIRKIVCICGSTRFVNELKQAIFDETMKGNMVFAIDVNMKNDPVSWFEPYLKNRSLDEIKNDLDILHFEKIKASDEILVLNVDGYIGESTAKEIEYAASLGLPIRYLYTPA